jgi:two-component system chemotaxis response regulator CheY
MKKSILVVDDEPLVRKALARLFLNEGCEVFEAENGAQGLELYLSKKPDFVFLDIMMPLMTGPEFVQNLKNKGFSLSNIIIMSAIKESQSLPFINEVKFFVTKPFENLFDLKKIIHEHH